MPSDPDKEADFCRYINREVMERKLLYSTPLVQIPHPDMTDEQMRAQWERALAQDKVLLFYDDFSISYLDANGPIRHPEGRTIAYALSDRLVALSPSEEGFCVSEASLMVRWAKKCAVTGLFCPEYFAQRILVHIKGHIQSHDKNGDRRVNP